MAGNWIAKAVSRHPGLFTAKAKRAGMSTAQYARSVRRSGSQASTRTKREAALAQTLRRLNKRA